MRWAGQEVILRLTTVPAGCTGANALRDPCFEPWHTYVMKATHIHIQSENTTLAWLRLNIGIKKICLRLCAVQRSPRTTTSLQLPLEFHTFSYVGQYFQWFSARVAQYIPPRTTKILDFLNAFQWFSTPYWGPSLLRSMILYPILGCLASKKFSRNKTPPYLNLRFSWETWPGYLITAFSWLRQWSRYQSCREWRWIYMASHLITLQIRICTYTLIA